MNNGHLTVLCGLPRSGKSTWSKEWLQDPFYISSCGTGLPRVIVNSDSVRIALHGQRYIRAAEPFVHAITKVMVKSLFFQGFHVLIDETNTTHGSIKQWLEVDPFANFIYFDTSVEVCQQRARNTKQEDLIPVISRIYENLQKLQWESVALWEDVDGIIYVTEARDFEVTEHRLMKSIEMIRNQVCPATKEDLCQKKIDKITIKINKLQEIQKRIKQDNCKHTEKKFENKGGGAYPTCVACEKRL